MRIKHYVITRFLCDRVLGLFDKILDNDIILNSVNYVKHYFIPSLNNQTNKNFEIIFLVHDTHDIQNSNIKLLNDVDTSIRIHIIKKSQLNSFIKDNLIGYDFLITSRFDYDDLIINTAVDEIQNMISENKNDIFTYGYCNGLVLKNNTIYKHNFYDYVYFSSFLSLCLNLHSIHQIYNVYDLGDHMKTCKSLPSFCDKIGVTFDESMFIKPKTDKYYYVWVRHENTASSLLNYNNEKIGDKIQIGNFKELFGIDYE